MENLGAYEQSGNACGTYDRIRRTQTTHPSIDRICESTEVIRITMIE
jgi:hypothetical protein